MFFTACNRVKGMQFTQAVTGAATQLTPQTPQPSAAAQRVPAISSSPQAVSASPSPPGAAPKSDASAPKVVGSDRSQTLIIAQQTFRFATHVQSIASTNEETVEWCE